MSSKITISLPSPARFLDVQPKTSEDNQQIHSPNGVPIWRFRCVIDMDTRNITAPATVEEIKALKYFAPIFFNSLMVGTFKDNLYLTASGLNQNPENLPLRKLPPLKAP